MRRAALVLFLIMLVGRASADDLDILTPKPGEPSPSTMLRAYLEVEARTHFDARRKAVTALKTAEDVARRRNELRAKFWAALGELPERTPLEPRVLGREQRHGYTVERVIYQSRPRHHVTALLYLPDAEPPFPGVLVPCGHDAKGKAAEAYQRACILMAKNGLPALCFDPISQGERSQWLDDAGKPKIASSTQEHTAIGMGALLVGRSAAGYRLWDAMRSLDYLASRSEIDPARLACSGNSGGGTETAYLMALDDRVSIAAPSCYITSLERLFATIGPQDAEQNVTGQVAFGMEHADYVTMRAPKPTLLSVGTRDFFDIQGSWDTFREVKRIYCMLGHGERVDLFESDEEHGWTKPRRQACVGWLCRWLLGKDELVTEADSPIASDKELQCTTSGQVQSEFRGESVFELDKKRALELALERARSFHDRDRETLLRTVRRTIALREPAIRAQVTLRGEVERDGIVFRKLTLEPEPGITLPMVKRPGDPTSKEPLVILVCGSDGVARGQALSGQKAVTRPPVLIVDLRGRGETDPGRFRQRRQPFGSDSREAFLALHLDRPLLGQRVGDLLAVIDAMSGEEQVHLVAFKEDTAVALHAAALSPKVAKLTLVWPTLSWTSLVGARGSGDLAGVVPGALLAYDLPDLAAAFAPRPLSVYAPLAGSLELATPQELEDAYAIVRAAYRAKGAEAELNLHSGPRSSALLNGLIP